MSERETERGICRERDEEKCVRERKTESIPVKRLREQIVENIAHSGAYFGARLSYWGAERGPLLG